MKNKIISEQTTLNTRFKNFLLYVYSLGGFGIGLIFFLANIFGNFFFSFGQSTFLTISLIVCFIGMSLESTLNSFLFNFELVLQRSVSSLLVFFGLKIFISGILLAPLFMVAKRFDPLAIVIAFVTTLITFIVFTVFVFLSGKDLAFRKNESNAKTFGRILAVGIISLLTLVLIQIVSILFFPSLVDKIDTLVLLVSLLLALIFVVYNNALIRDMYTEFSHDGVALSRLGICGATRIIDSFILLFKIILRILLKVRRKND